MSSLMATITAVITSTIATFTSSGSQERFAVNETEIEEWGDITLDERRLTKGTKSQNKVGLSKTRAPSKVGHNLSKNIPYFTSLSATNTTFTTCTNTTNNISTTTTPTSVFTTPVFTTHTRPHTRTPSPLHHIGEGTSGAGMGEPVHRYRSLVRLYESLSFNEHKVKNFTYFINSTHYPKFTSISYGKSDDVFADLSSNQRQEIQKASYMVQNVICQQHLQKFQELLERDREKLQQLLESTTNLFGAEVATDMSLRAKREAHENTQKKITNKRGQKRGRER